MAEIDQIRWTNFIVMGFITITNLIFFLSDCLLNKPFLAGLAVIAGYLFICFSFWFFLIFLFSEIRYTIKNKVNFFNHMIKNKLVISGIILMLIHIFVITTGSSICY